MDSTSSFARRSFSPAATSGAGADAAGALTKE
jgi:hypothetical protein